jgi:hypothetical protein
VVTLDSVAGGEESLKQHGAHDIIDGPNHALGLDVREEKSARGQVIKLSSIITLDTPDSVAKLCGHVSEEVRKGGEVVGLATQR